MRPLIAAALLCVACTGTPSPAAVQLDRERHDTFGPLEVGADYATYRRLTERPFLSAVHGDRWVDVYVSEPGADAYLRGAPIPVGTVIVKASFEGADGGPSAVPGPYYVMEKRAPGYAPEHDDWYYALHWAAPTGAFAKRFPQPVYWRGVSRHVDYCWECHESYDRALGGLTPSSVVPR